VANADQDDYMIIPAPGRVKPHVQLNVAKQISPMRTIVRLHY